MHPNVEQEARADADLDTLVTALYVQVDDLLKADPDRTPWRPAVGIAPKISDAELVTLAVAQAVLGLTSEARWLRFGRTRLRGRSGIAAHSEVDPCNSALTYPDALAKKRGRAVAGKP